MARPWRRKALVVPSQVPSPSTLESDQNLAILLATYQIERQDEQNSSVLNMAVTGAGLAFILAATAYLNAQGKNLHLPDWLALGAAIPVWTLAGLIVYQVAASRLRMSYILHLESILSGPPPVKSRKTYPRYIALHYGLWESGGLRKNKAHILLAILTFVSPFVLSVLFTLFVMINVARNIDARLPVVIVYAIFYLLSAFLNAWVLMAANYGMTERRQVKLNSWAESKLAKHVQDW